MIQYKKANIIDAYENSEIDVLLHGCNCFCAMGKGIALQLKNKFPKIYKHDKLTIKGDRTKLGNIELIDCPTIQNPSGIIVNCYTQYTYWDKTDMFYYSAFESCMKKVDNVFDNSVKIAMPTIGCGLANGEWNTCELLLNKIFNNRIVTVYYL